MMTSGRGSGRSGRCAGNRDTVSEQKLSLPRGQVYKAAMISCDIQTHLHFGKDEAYLRKANLGRSGAETLPSLRIGEPKADSIYQFNLELLSLR